MIRKTAVRRKTAPSQPDAMSAPGETAEAPTPGQRQMSAYAEAVALFSSRRFAEALDRFHEVSGGPDTHVADKARSYAQVCERRMASLEPDLHTAEDHFNYGVERLNERDFARATRHFERAIAIEPRAEHVYYTMALCLGLAGDGTGACENLKRAIELEPRNRIIARQDPEFTAILPQFPGLRTLLFETRA